MFISHLCFFLSLIVLIVFLSHLKSNRLFERFIACFALLTFTNNSLWLLYLYYEFNYPLFVDNYGVISEIFALLLPIFSIWHIKSIGVNSYKIPSILLMVALGAGLTFFHFVISDSKYLFLENNTKYESNISFQLAIDLLALLAFALLFFKKNKKLVTEEIFDGSFKRNFGIVFFTYYFQDIIVLILLKEPNLVREFQNELRLLSISLSLITTVFLGIMGIATNYLPIWHKIILENDQNKDKEPFSNQLFKENFLISFEDLSIIKPITWQNIKISLHEKLPRQIDQIDSNENLSKTEKIYSLLKNSNLSHKEIADLLSVSVRTVETNFYRLRLKEKQCG